MTFTEGPNIGFNVLHNNNIVWKNTTVVDSVAGIVVGGGCHPEIIQGIGVTVGVNNIEDKLATYNIMLSIPEEERGTPITAEGTVMLTLDEKLYQKWIQGGRQGSGFKEILSPPMSQEGVDNSQINTNSPIVEKTVKLTI